LRSTARRLAALGAALACATSVAGCSGKATAPAGAARFGWVALSRGEKPRFVERGITRDDVLAMDSLGEPLFAVLILQAGATNQVLALDHSVERCGPARSGIVFGRAGKHARMPTVAQILSHQSGLAVRSNSTLLTFEPGARWSRSDDAMLCLQRNLERESQSGLDDLARAGLLQSLGMLKSGWVRKGDSPPEPLARVPGDTRAHASRTFTGSLGDLASYIGCVLSRQCPGLGEPILEQQEQPRAVADASRRVSWGLGWGIFESNGERVLAHFGQPSSNAYRLLVVVPSRGLAVAVVVEDAPDARREAGEIARRELHLELAALDSPVFDRTLDRPTIDLTPSPHQHHHATADEAAPLPTPPGRFRR
jgi:CubicO group peptidase (beta-lactamase class C family)